MNRQPSHIALTAAILLGCGSQGPMATEPPQTDASLEDLAMRDLVAPPDVMAMDVFIDPPRDAPQDQPPPVDLGTDSRSDDVRVADASAGPYPPGPYGNRMGDVIANLSWEGYVNPTGGAISTTRAFGPTSLQELRASGRGFALVHVSEFY